MAPTTPDERIDKMAASVERLIVVVGDLLRAAEGGHAIATALALEVDTLRARIERLEQRAAATAWKGPH